jgi:AcrR family transcriptional regulator
MNTTPGSVPKREDRRVVRTRQALGAALVALMREQEFDSISVQQVLDQAKVGRATFYTHFRGKHDLLLSDAERMLDALERHFLARDATSRRLAPVAELFAHVGEFAWLDRAIARAGLREALFGLIGEHTARLLERRLRALRPSIADASVSPVVSSRVLAGALVELLRWWLDRASRPDAREMDRQFHLIAWRGVEGIAPLAARDASP